MGVGPDDGFGDEFTATLGAVARFRREASVLYQEWRHRQELPQMCLAA